MLDLRCKFCDLPVDPNQLGVYRYVKGWEKARRKGGGTNALRLRERTDTYAHSPCIDSEVRGRRGQDNLF